MLATLARLVPDVLFGMLGMERRCRPLFPLYHVTPFCNLRCAYCDGFPELGLPPERAIDGGEGGACEHQLSTEEVKRLLGIVRDRFDYLFLTGGEPLVRDDIEEIVEHAGWLGFRGISINTNAILLPEREGILPHVSNLVVSLDMLDAERYGALLGCDAVTAGTIIENVRRYKAREKEHGYTLSVHAVILPGAVERAAEVLDFCRALDVPVCVSPLQAGYRADPSFERDAAYAAFINRVIRLKRGGERISGTVAYYENIRSFETYRCMPMLIPRILPNGRLLYPCRPKGIVAGSLLEAGSWGAAEREARSRYGRVERCERSCRIRCYIEPSLCMRRPLSMIREFAGQL